MLAYLAYNLERLASHSLSSQYLGGMYEMSHYPITLMFRTRL